MDDSRRSIYQQRSSPANSGKPSKFKVKRRQTFHSQRRHGGMFSTPPMHFEVAELIRKPTNNLSVPRIIPQRGSSSSSTSNVYGSTKNLARLPTTSVTEVNRSFLTVEPLSSRPSSVELIQQRRPSCNSMASSIGDSGSYKQKNYLCPIADVSSVKARIPTPELSSDTTSLIVSNSSKSPSVSSYGGGPLTHSRHEAPMEEKPRVVIETIAPKNLDVQSIINERRPSKLKPLTSAFASNFGHHLYVTENDDTTIAATSVAEVNDEKEDERHYVSVGVGPSSVELRIFVDDTIEPNESALQETQAGRRCSEPEAVIVIEGSNGKRRTKSPPGPDDAVA